MIAVLSGSINVLHYFKFIVLFGKSRSLAVSASYLLFFFFFFCHRNMFQEESAELIYATEEDNFMALDMMREGFTSLDFQDSLSSLVKQKNGGRDKYQ